MSLLSLNNISIGHNKPLYESINLEVKQGEFIGLIGANGTGKSTLIQTIAGLIPSLFGKILLKNIELKNLSPQVVAKNIALVNTREEINTISVYDFVGLGRIPKTGFFGRLKANDDKIIRKALDQVNVETFTKKNLFELSDGQRQRVFIAKALAQETPILLLDEPTAFLDYSGKIEVIKLLKELTSQHQKTIIFSSHDLELTFEYTDKIWCFYSNQIHCEKPSNKLKKDFLENLLGEEYRTKS